MSRRWAGWWWVGVLATLSACGLFPKHPDVLPDHHSMSMTHLRAQAWRKSASMQTVMDYLVAVREYLDQKPSALRGDWDGPAIAKDVSALVQERRPRASADERDRLLVALGYLLFEHAALFRPLDERGARTEGRLLLDTHLEAAGDAAWTLPWLHRFASCRTNCFAFEGAERIRPICLAAIAKGHVEEPHVFETEWTEPRWRGSTKEVLARACDEALMHAHPELRGVLLPERLAWLPPDLVARFALQDDAYQAHLRRQRNTAKSLASARARAAFVSCPLSLMVGDETAEQPGSVDVRMAQLDPTHGPDRRCLRAGELSLPSGTLIAGDPWTSMSGAQPLDVHVRPGRYPVVLTTYGGETRGEDVLAATVVFSRETPTRWEVARYDGDLPDANLGAVYGVDAGTGAFADAELQPLLQDSELVQRTLDRYLTVTRQRSHAVLDGFVGTEANLVAFTSGVGDGVYASYFAYGASGALVAVMTNFDLPPRAPVTPHAD